MLGFVHADEGTRTPTVLLPLEPESSASANSATSAWMFTCETVALARTSIIISQVNLKVNTFFEVFLSFFGFFCGERYKPLFMRVREKNLSLCIFGIELSRRGRESEAV